MSGHIAASTIAASVLTLALTMGQLHARPEGRAYFRSLTAQQTSRPGGILAPTTPPRTESATPAKQASISGRVIGADTGRVLRRARVTLSPITGGQVRTVTTGVDGAFVFNEVPAGQYMLSASRAGYVRLAYGQTRPLEQGQPIEVRAGPALSGLNFNLPPMSAISGRIMDETGEPFPGVAVFALAPAYADGVRQWLPTGEATTDDTGRYRIADLMPGTYLLMATVSATWTIREGGEERVHGYASTYLPGAPDLGGASRITVALGQQANAVDFPLIPGRMATVSGTVINSRGEPSVGETVYVTQELRTAGGISRTERGGSVIQADGSFVIRNLAPGDYRLAVRDVEAQPTTHVEEAAVVPLTIDGNSIDDLQIVTSGAWVIEGTVRMTSGAPPPSTTAPGNLRPRVVASPASPSTDRRLGGAPIDNGFADANGRFRIEHLWGPARLSTILPDSLMLVSIEHQGRDLTSAPIEMAGRQTLSNVEVIVTDRVTSVLGSVMDARGQPSPSGTVIVFTTDRTRWGPNSRFVRSIRPDQSGRFELRGLPPDEYYAVALAAVPDGAWQDPEFLLEASVRAERLSLREGSQISVALRP